MTVKEKPLGETFLEVDLRVTCRSLIRVIIWGSLVGQLMTLHSSGSSDKGLQITQLTHQVKVIKRSFIRIINWSAPSGHSLSSTTLEQNFRPQCYEQNLSFFFLLFFLFVAGIIPLIVNILCGGSCIRLYYIIVYWIKSLVYCKMF